MLDFWAYVFIFHLCPLIPGFNQVREKKGGGGGLFFFKKKGKDFFQIQPKKIIEKKN